MAEVFATVASGAGLASLGLQLAACAVKMKRFYEDVEKAPKSLSRLSRDINTFALLLRQIDDTRSRHGFESCGVLEECIELCGESTQDIIMITRHLETIMQRYRIAGRVLSTLRKREVLDACADLERSKNSLMIAFQLFDHRTQVRMMEASQDWALQQSLVLFKHGEAIARIREDTSQLHAMHQSTIANFRTTATSDEEGSGIHYPSEQPSTVARQRRKPYRFRLPLWFSSKIWALTTYRSRGCWRLFLQTYNYLPAYTPIVAHYLAGRVDVVRTLYNNGQASPYDVYGHRTPLELAVLSGSVDMFKFLQTCDLIDGQEVLDHALEFWKSLWFDVPHTTKDVSETDIPQKLLRIVECLVGDRRIDLDETYSTGIGNHSMWFSPNEILLLFNEHTTQPLRTLTTDERLDCLDLRFSSDQINMNILDSLISPLENLSSIDRIEKSLGAQPLHLIAVCMGRHIENQLSRSDVLDSMNIWISLRKDPILQRLKHLLFKAYQLGCDLCATDSRGNTPLIGFLGEGRRWIDSMKDLLAFQYWADCISETSLDLLDYGQKEREIWRWACPIRVGWRNDALHGYKIRALAVDFDYGRNIDEWHLVVEQQTYIPIYKLESTPGSWPLPTCMPRSICWRPRHTHLPENDRWILDREVVIDSGPLPVLPSARVSRSVRLLQSTQDDSLAAARVLAKVEEKQETRRRSQSQPPALQHPLHHRYVDGTAKPWPKGWFYFCPFCNERFVSQDYTCHRWNQVLETCETSHLWNSTRLFQSLVSWRDFVREWSCKPVRCCDAAPTSILSPMMYHAVEAWDIFSHPNGTWVCNEFPDCLHQRSYCDFVSIE